MAERAGGDGRTRSMINVPVMKLVGLYQCLDPAGRRLCGFHLFKTAAVVQAAYVVGFCALDAITVAGCADDLNMVAKYALLMVNAANVAFKLYYVVSRAPQIWRCLRLASFDFLSCGRRSRRRRYPETAADDDDDDAADILPAGRSLSVKATDLFLFMWTCVVASWISSPLLVRPAADGSYLTVDCVGIRGRFRYNSINIVALVSDEFYNRHFTSFYLIESLAFLCCAHAMFVFDLLAMSLSITIVYQLKTVARSYGRLQVANQCLVPGRKPRKEIDTYLVDFKALIKDQQLVTEKIYEIYKVFRPVTFIQLASESVSIILLPLLICMNTHNGQSVLSLSNINLIITFVTVLSHLYITCFLYTSINDQKMSMNFALYSSDWTQMSIEYQKLLLYTMQMNDAEKTTLKISPTRIVNLKMFANIIHTSYSILSVLVKSYRST